MMNNNYLTPLEKYPDSKIVNLVSRVEYTYEEFGNHINRMSDILRNLEVGKGQILVIYGYKDSFQILLLIYACIKLKLIPYVVEMGNIAAVNDLAYAALITPYRQNLKLLNAEQETELQNAWFYKAKTEKLYTGSENDFLIVSSSGSTSGYQKKILFGRKQTYENIISNQKALGIRKEDVSLVLLPLSYSYGLIAQFMTHFNVGADVVLNAGLLGVLHLSDLLSKYKVSTMFLTPLLARLILCYNKGANWNENVLRFITVGGDKAHIPTLKKIHKLLNCDIYGTYGLAEAGPRVATHRFDLQNISQSLLTIGKVNPKVKVDVVANHFYQKLTGNKNVGYLRIKSPSIYLGYIEGSELRKNRSGKVLLTKDIADVDERGMRILGRENDFFLNDGKVRWFSELSQNLYDDVNVLKIKIKKQDENKILISAYYRSPVNEDVLRKSLSEKLHLTQGRDYELKLIEFANNQYK